MVAMPNLSDAGVERDTASEAQASPAATTEREVQAKYRGECVDDGDLGSVDLPEDYEEYHERGFYHPFD